MRSATAGMIVRVEAAARVLDYTEASRSPPPHQLIVLPPRRRVCGHSTPLACQHAQDRPRSWDFGYRNIIVVFKEEKIVINAEIPDQFCK